MSPAPLQTLKDTLLSVTQFYFGRFPSRRESLEMNKLGNRLCEPYSDLHEHLLQDIHRLSGVQVPYQRIGKFWKYLGYQNENPASDIRGGGLLSLDNLIYLLSTHPKMAQRMLHRQSRDNLSSENQMESYPWAAVGINVTRYIATEFELIEPSGRLKTSNFSPKTTWAYLSQSEGFNRLYCLAFFLLNSLWHEMKATYMQFPQVLSAMKTEFSSFLMSSSSLSELEIAIFRRVNYSFDPSHGIDYTVLPESSDISADQRQQVQDQCYSIEYDLLELGGYGFGSQSQPSGESSSSHLPAKKAQTMTPDFLCSDFLFETHPSSLSSTYSFYGDLELNAEQGGLRRRRSVVSAV
jgi:ELMO domain-containing protein